MDILVYLEQFSEQQDVFIFLYAEKAFDSLNWMFFFKFLENDCRFIKWIKSVYTSQKTQMMENLNTPVKYRKRHNKDFSYYYYLFVLEVLNRNIRQNEKTAGWRIKRQIYQLDISWWPGHNFGGSLEEIEILMEKLKDLGV